MKIRTKIIFTSGVSVVAGLCLLLTSSVAEAALLPASFCYTFTKNLQSGSTGKDVTTLQLILADRGFLKLTDIGATTYNTKLATAVSAFQEKYAAEILKPSKLKSGTGVVGAATRAKLNSLYSCSSVANNPSAPITASVISALATPTPTPFPTATPLPVEIINAQASAPQILHRSWSGQPLRASFNLRFTIVNRNDDPLFISKNPALAVATQSNLDTAGASVTYINSPDTVSINPANVFYVAAHSNRTFNVGTLLNNFNGPNGTADAFINISRVFYSTTTENIADFYNQKTIFTHDVRSGFVTLGSEL